MPFCGLTSRSSGNGKTDGRRRQWLATSQLFYEPTARASCSPSTVRRIPGRRGWPGRLGQDSGRRQRRISGSGFAGFAEVFGRSEPSSATQDIGSLCPGPGRCGPGRNRLPRRSCSRRTTAAARRDGRLQSEEANGVRVSGVNQSDVFVAGATRGGYCVERVVGNVQGVGCPL